MPAPATRPLPALAGAVACAVVLALTGLAGLVVLRARAADAAALHALMGLDRPRTHGLLDLLAHAADPVPYALASLLLVGLALARGRVAVAALLPVLLLGSGATTQALKHALATPRLQDFLTDHQISPTAWPSGHSTAAMALALALVFAVPRAVRPVAAVAGAALALGVGLAVVALGWHYPSDVLGGFLCAAGWAFLVVAALRALAPERVAAAPAPRASWQLAGTLLVVCAAAAVLLGVAVALARPDVVAVVARPAAVAAVAAIAALAALIPLGMSRATEL